jgi:hypothetical protein
MLQAKSKDFGKGKSMATVSLRSWQVKADSIRKLSHRNPTRSSP